MDYNQPRQGGGLASIFTSPLFVMGANVLGADNVGQGLARGVQQAQGFARDQAAQQRQDQEFAMRKQAIAQRQAQAAQAQAEEARRQEAFNAYLQGANLPGGVPQLLQAVGPDKGVGLALDYLPKPQAPLSALDQARIAKIKAETEALQGKGNEAPQYTGGGFGAQGIDENGNLILAQYRNDLSPEPWQPVEPPNAANPQGGGFERMDFGQKAMNPSDVPGVVVTPQGASDKFATREKQAQQAYQQTNEGDQERLKRHIATQRLWTNINGKPPSGYIYAPDGTLMDMKDRAPVDLKSALPRAKQALASLDAAESKLTDESWGIATRGPRMYGNIGDTGQAVKDIEQAALQIVYLLSGKQTSFAEMQKFTQAYVPEPLDTSWRIKQKVGRVRSMLQGIVDGVKSGMTYDEAFAKARASIFDKKDAGGGDLSGMSDDELLKQLGAQ